jgi:hypothetical protein
VIRWWKRIALLFLLIGGCIGLLLRYSFVDTPFTGFTYRYWLHAHSHTMLLAWLFNAAFILWVERTFRSVVPPAYVRLFGALQVANAGMLITFPVTGYAAASIAFSTLHILLSFAVIALFIRDHRGSPAERETLLWALGFLLVSSVGPFAVGVLTARGMRESPLYDLAIYFYLHFQYNGWLTFILMATLYPFDRAHASSVRFNIRLLGVSTVLSFSLSALWLGAGRWLMAVGLFSAFLQVFALAGMYRAGSFTLQSILQSGSRGARTLTWLVLAAIATKLALQILSAFPAAVSWYYFDRSLPIAYVHLVFLGALTPIVLVKWTMACSGRMLQLAVFLYAVAFALSESLMVAESVGLKLHGRSIPYYYALLAGASAILVISLLALNILFWRKGTETAGGSN